MEDQLLNYYERELTFIRKMGAEFAKTYPKIAGRLLLEPDKCDDPHTERLIEAFAFLAGRIHKKIDDDFPEITESLLNIIYPHYIRPIPSMAVVEFEPIKQNISPAGYKIDKGTSLFSKPVKGVPCQFTTCQPVTIWPAEVAGAGIKDPPKLLRDSLKAIWIEINAFENQALSHIKWESLRFFLNGPHQHIFHLYELLFNNACHLEVEIMEKPGSSKWISLDPGHISQVGFEPDEGMIPYSKRSFPGYLLLFEYFCFPEKFLFFDIKGLEKLSLENPGEKIKIWIYLNAYPKSNLLIDKNTFCLNTTPVINLFERIAEPIRVEHHKTDYRVIPDIRRQEAMEVFSVDRVSAIKGESGEKDIDFKPFYSIRHHLSETQGREKNAFWHITRRPSEKKGDSGTDVFLSFADPDFKPTDPGVEIVTVRTTCTNRDLPGRLPFGDPSGDFDLETAAPITKIKSIIRPTKTRRPYMGRALQWRLISHLSLNYMSIVEGGEEALKEILKLYDFDDSPATRQQISGIVKLDSAHVTKRLGQSFCRGIRTTITFDEDKFVGAGLFLFASVLERFLGQYVSVNSVSQLVAKTTLKEGILKIWNPRSGRDILI